MPDAFISALGSILGQELFSMFFNTLGAGLKGISSKFADITKLG